MTTHIQQTSSQTQNHQQISNCSKTQQNHPLYLTVITTITNFLHTEIPSPATDSNSNDTGGSPSSITSGTSPVQSPLLNCSSSNAIVNSTINNHSESTSTDYTDKRNSYNKNESSSTKVTVSLTFSSFVCFFLMIFLYLISPLSQPLSELVKSIWIYRRRVTIVARICNHQ